MSSDIRHRRIVQAQDRDSCRLFQCGRCSKQVLLCRACDRGNRYCGPVCSRQARADSLRRAGARYQRSEAGKINHAARQQAYLARRDAKMTHQGSRATEETSSSPATDAVPAEVKEQDHEPIQANHHLEDPDRSKPTPHTGTRSPHPKAPSSSPRRCSGCGASLPSLVRRRFLHEARGSPRR